jgi:hypothetical protein
MLGGLHHDHRLAARDHVVGRMGEVAVSIAPERAVFQELALVLGVSRLARRLLKRHGPTWSTADPLLGTCEHDSTP